MNSIEKAVCFTGHREIENIKEVETKLQAIVEELINNGYRFFIVGGARGFDTLAAKTVLLLKEKYPHIMLMTVLPFPKPFNYEKGWSDDDINDHIKCLRLSRKAVALNPHYTWGCYYQRNRYMVDHSSLCVAYQRRSKGGTAYTVNYAEKQNRKIFYI